MDRERGARLTGNMIVQQRRCSHLGSGGLHLLVPREILLEWGDYAAECGCVWRTVLGGRRLLMRMSPHLYLQGQIERP
jgi:hypothetical protein